MTTTPPRSARRREEIIPMKRTPFVGVSVTWDFLNVGDAHDFAYLAGLNEFWNWFMKTGKGESSKIHLLTGEWYFCTFTTRFIIQLCQNVLILYDDAFYKFQLEADNFHGQWRIVKDATVTCSTHNTDTRASGLTETNPALFGVKRCADTDNYNFILRQSMNTFASTGFDLYKKEHTVTDHMFDEWLFKRREKIFKEI